MKKGSVRANFLLSGVVMLAIWPGSVLLGGWRENPFVVATEAAAEMGGWSPESVRFRGGSYSALPFVFLTHAEVLVSTHIGEKTAEIEILHVPLLGQWMVRRFNAGLAAADDVSC